MKKSIAYILLMLATAAQAPTAVKADELKTLGFSPEGRWFAFEQKGSTTEGGPYSLTTVMEVETSRPAKGSRITYDGEDKKKLTKINRATVRQIKRLKITNKDLLTVSVRGFGAEPFEDAAVKSFVLPSKWFGPDASLVLRTIKLVTQRCKTTNAPPIGYGLVLERVGAPAVQLSHDLAITPSRGCPTRYRIAEIHTRLLKDGGAALAVIVQDLTPGVSGENQGFTAVTAKVPAKTMAKAQ
jgi:predicted secreted protein